MNDNRTIYSMRSLDFFIKTIGIDLDSNKETDELYKDKKCDFYTDPFLEGITNGEYFIAIYNIIRNLTDPLYTRPINLLEQAVFFNLFNQSVDLLKDKLNDWEFSEYDGMDCWKLYVVCARNQDLPIWENDNDEIISKPALKTLTIEDWDYILEVIEDEYFNHIGWLSANNYKDLADKIPSPSDQEYEEAITWLLNAYYNIWINKSKLFKKQTIDSQVFDNSSMVHDFFQFMHIIKDEMAHEYKRVHSRSQEDPGTAGDQIEENWAEFLRNWLPSNYPIVTKGKLIDTKGLTSPQIDILVLNPSYPIGLRNKKHYFAAGVVAAFECKLTLRKEHLKKFFSNSTFIKRMQQCSEGTPYDELQQFPIYGLLANSHNWKKSKNVQGVLHNSFYDIGNLLCKHPRELPDIICVADTCTFIMSKTINIGPFADIDGKEIFKSIDKNGGVTTGYTSHNEDCYSSMDLRGTILGTLIYRITELMAFKDQSLKLFVEYLSNIRPMMGIGRLTLWDKTVLSEKVGHVLIQKGYSNECWSKWADTF